MTSSRIHGKEYPVEEILNGNFVFNIPRYQRPYAWGVDQAQTLLEDLLSAIGDLDDKSDDIESYFLGSIVVVKNEHEKNADVVDGQQRLTTLTILLAAIRACTQDDKNRANVTELIYKQGNLITNTGDRFHLTLRERDAEFFQEMIQKDINLEIIKNINLANLSESQKNITRNARKFLELLSGFSQSQILNLARYIVTQTFIIVVATPNIESAYRIFSVLNDRGLDLSYTDICKANIIGQIESAQQDKYTNKWEELEELVGRENFKEVFSHIRTIHRKARIKDTILKELQQYVFPSYNPKDFIDTVLIPFTESYDIIQTASFESEKLAESINKVLYWLREIDNTDWMPVALNFYKKNKNNSENLLSFLIDLERLASSMMIRRENVNTRQMRYIRILEIIDNDSDIFELDSPLQLSAKEKTETINRLEGDIYNHISRLYILRRLDAEYSEGKTTPNLKVITVEHILPQNPDIKSKWIEWFPNEEERKNLTHKIGNLALLSKRKNSQAQNFEFDKKKQLYFNSPITPFALTTLIINETKWTKEILEKRHKENIAILKHLWRLT